MTPFIDSSSTLNIMDVDGHILMRHPVGSETDLHICVSKALEHAASNRIPLQEAVLDDINIQGVNLAGIDLTGASMVGATLKDVNLSDSILTGADMQAIEMNSVNLEGANLTKTIQTKATLNNVSMFKADVGEMILKDATATNLNLNDVSSSPHGVNFSGGYFEGLSLLNAHLSNSNFNQATVYKSNLNDARLHDSSMQDTTIIDSSMVQTQVHGAKGLNTRILNTIVTNTPFEHSELEKLTINNKKFIVGVDKNVNMPYFNYTDEQAQKNEAIKKMVINALTTNNTSLIDQIKEQHLAQNPNSPRLNLRGVDLTNTDLKIKDFSGLDLTGAKFSEKSMESAIFDHADLTGAKFLGSKPNALSKCHGMSFESAVLKGTQFRFIDLGDVNMTGANVNNLKFKSTEADHINLDHTQISGLHLKNTIAKEVTLNHSVAMGIRVKNSVVELNAKSATIFGLDAIRSNIGNSDLSGISNNLAAINVLDSAMDNTNFSDATIQLITVANTSAKGANFKHAEINEGEFFNSDLTQSDFSQAQLIDSSMNDNNLKDASFVRTEYKGGVFMNCDMHGANTAFANFATNNFYGNKGIERVVAMERADPPISIEATVRPKPIENTLDSSYSFGM